MSRGAMYHHFGSKRDLFEAVFEEVAVDAIRQAIREADTAESPLGQLTAASLTWLRVVRDRQVATILIEQAPNVLGWRQARAVEERTTLGLMRGALDRAVAAGEIDVVSVPVTAQLLSALLAEEALVDANGVPDVSRADLEASVRRFIDGLRSPPARSRR